MSCSTPSDTPKRQGVKLQPPKTLAPASQRGAYFVLCLWSSPIKPLLLILPVLLSLAACSKTTEVDAVDPSDQVTPEQLAYKKSLAEAKESQLLAKCKKLGAQINELTRQIDHVGRRNDFDYSAPRATMRASSAAMGAQTQANILNYGLSMGCKFTELKFPQLLTVN